MNQIKILFALLMIQYPLLVHSQQDSLVKVTGVIRAESSKAIIPHATIASYSRVVMFIANDEGRFSITVPQNDSLKFTALGFEPVTVRVIDLKVDSTKNIAVFLRQHSYAIKEVTVKGYNGIFDPLIFQKHLPEEELIQLNLPGNFGSRMSKLPPNERPLVGKPTVLSAVASPVSAAYSLFSKREKSLRHLTKARTQEIQWDHREAVAGRDVIAAVSGYKDEMLEAFLIYCNIHLKISPADTGTSATRKIEALLEEYEKLKKE
ncbi:carboxypeptidase-like regulatory domain-containing protein [Geofilum sp. OHC36d9]|uniref:carboxypeptidase-like regulatory domain-containing protein n=1 Tax=Geofilum sp. OHC36d9 TaxID=3458413 RepID=UPI0040337B64